MTSMTGELKIHKSDGVTRVASKAEVLDDGSLAVWDDKDNDEPDIIVTSDYWQRIEKEGHSWRRSNYKQIMEEAKNRDDVDEDELSNIL